MANLLIDLGNSNCKAAFHSNGELVCVYKDTGEDLEQFLNFLDIQWKEKFGEEKIDVIVFSNVREENAKIENLLNLKCRELVVLNEHTRLPKTLTYAFCPTGLGGDRLAGALAVSMLFPNEDCLKFDFGTALTIDFIDKEGFYAGGNISLGLQTRLKALNTFTKRLPLITRNKEFEKIGVSTSGAMTAGVVLGLIFEVEGYIKNNPARKVIFTGGDSYYFAEKLKNTIFVIPNLVLIGLGQIANYYADCKNY